MMSLNTQAPATLHERLSSLAATRPDAPAVVDLSAVGGGHCTTYGELAERASRSAAFLASLGVRRGDSVATLLPNCQEWIDLFFAAAQLGALLVPLNTRYRSQEIGHLLRLSGARVLVTATDFEGVNFTDRLAEVAAFEGDDAVPLKDIVIVSGDIEATPARWQRHPGRDLSANAAPIPPAAGEPADPLIVFGTSGTTSAPKLAIHTHQTVLTHMDAVADRMRFSPDSSQLVVLSLSGTFGFVPFMAGLLAGQPATMLPIFKRERVLTALESHPSDFLVAAEGSVRELLEAAGPADLGALNRIVTAGLAIEDIIDAATGRGITAMNVYGSSEVFAFAAISEYGADTAVRANPGGRVTGPDTLVRVTDPESGAVLPIGSVGELQFSGPSVFSRYLHNDAATVASRTPDGWFRTGDSARLIDDCTFTYLARANDTLRLGGYSVSPSDVETTLEELDGIRQAQVVGVRDTRSGDDLGVAFVIAEAGSDITPERVLEYCTERMASFKVPKRVVMVNSYPSTPSANGDKIRRDQLRDQATALLAEHPSTQPLRNAPERLLQNEVH
ncbi:AMP-binding protein [Arthrobacter sp. NPDC058097]|uniref:AMP-binding protein n=1 Tax=Arthrobacter sp. NPDC058097 TaxID=3346340 RepID=UPI0036DA3067